MASIEDHIIELASAVSRIETKVDAVEKGVNGNGMPGLKQRVEGLEEHKNKVAGAVTVIGVIGGGIWGLLEYLFHFTSKGGH